MKVEEILQEIESMAMLDHPNVIKASRQASCFLRTAHWVWQVCSLSENMTHSWRRSMNTLKTKKVSHRSWSLILDRTTRLLDSLPNSTLTSY